MSSQQSLRYYPQPPFPSSSGALAGPRVRHDYGERPQARIQPRAQRSLAPDKIWGQYNNYRSNGLFASAIFHVAMLGLIFASASFGHQVVRQVQTYEHVTLIAPSPDSYTLPTSKRVVSGGGGGGDDDPMPAPKGRLPKLAMQQITPPQIVLRNEKPKLTAEPTVVVPPQVHLAENHMPNLGNPAAPPLPAAPPSNGTGSGGGIGAGSGGGIGVGHGPGVGSGVGGGIGGGDLEAASLGPVRRRGAGSGLRDWHY